MFGTEFHWPWPCFNDLLRPYVSRLPEGPPQGNNLAHIAQARSHSASPMPCLAVRLTLEWSNAGPSLSLFWLA
jgi:hypothetical protein